MPRRSLSALLALGLLVVAAGAVFGVAWWRSVHRSEFSRALELLPADTLRASWTDWAGLRTALDAGPLTDPDDIREFIRAAFSSDLSSASSIEDSAVAMATSFGFSPTDLEWEMLGHSRAGSVLMLQLDPSSADQVPERLSSLGYTAPTDDEGIWIGGPDVIARIDPTISPNLQFISVLDDGLVLASNTTSYLAVAVEAASGSGELSSGLDDLPQQVEEPLAATAFVGDFACEALAMSQADDSQQAAASRLVDAAGGIDPLTGLIVAAYDDDRLRVAMDFASDDQARRNAASRVALASGDAPGQGLAFPDVFSVSSARREGSAVVLDLHAQPSGYAFSNLTSGPVLFESC